MHNFKLQMKTMQYSPAVAWAAAAPRGMGSGGGARVGSTGGARRLGSGRIGDARAHGKGPTEAWRGLLRHSAAAGEA